MAPDALLAGANLVAGFAASRLLPANTLLPPFSFVGCCVAERFRPVLDPALPLFSTAFDEERPPLTLVAFLFLLLLLLAVSLSLLSVVVFFFAVFATEVDAFRRVVAEPAALEAAVAPLAPFFSPSPPVVLLFFRGDFELLLVVRPAGFPPEDDLDFCC